MISGKTNKHKNIHSLCLEKKTKILSAPQNNLCGSHSCQSLWLALPSSVNLEKKCVHDSSTELYVLVDVSDLHVYRTVVTVDRPLLQFPFGSTALSMMLQRPVPLLRHPSLVSLSSELPLLLPCCSLCQLCLL